MEAKIVIFFKYTTSFSFVPSFFNKKNSIIMKEKNLHNAFQSYETSEINTPEQVKGGTIIVKDVYVG